MREDSKGALHRLPAILWHFMKVTMDPFKRVLFTANFTAIYPCKFAVAYSLNEIATYANFRTRVTFTSKICFVRLVRSGLESVPHRGGVGSECVHRCVIPASLTSKILYFKNLLGSTSRCTTNYF